jgi:hypothetical protein
MFASYIIIRKTCFYEIIRNFIVKQQSTDRNIATPGDIALTPPQLAFCLLLPLNDMCLAENQQIQMHSL